MQHTQIIPILNEHTKDISKMKMLLLGHTDRLIKLEDLTDKILHKLDEMVTRFDSIDNRLEDMHNDIAYLKENSVYTQTKLGEFESRIFRLERYTLSKTV